MKPESKVLFLLCPLLSVLSVTTGRRLQIQFGDGPSTVAVSWTDLILAAHHGVSCPVCLSSASHCWISSPLLCLLYRHHLLQQMAHEGIRITCCV